MHIVLCIQNGNFVREKKNLWPVTRYSVWPGTWLRTVVLNARTVTDMYKAARNKNIQCFPNLSHMFCNYTDQLQWLRYIVFCKKKECFLCPVTTSAMWFMWLVTSLVWIRPSFHRNTFYRRPSTPWRSYMRIKSSEFEATLAFYGIRNTLAVVWRIY